MFKIRLSLSLLLLGTLAAPAFAGVSGASEAPFGPPVVAPTPTPAAPADPLLALPPFTFSSLPEVVKLELSLPAGTAVEERTSATEWRLVLPGWEVAPEALPPGGKLGFRDAVLGELALRPETKGISLVLPWKYWCPSAIDMVEPSADAPPNTPMRLTITLRKVYKVAIAEDLATGVVHEHVRMADAAGPLDIHVVRADQGVPGVKVVPSMSRRGFFGREIVSAIARRTGAVAAVNGAYFSPRTGEPLGLLMIDGELISGPLFNRTALALGDGLSEIGRAQLATRLVLPSGESYEFDGVNQQRGLNRMVLYTARYGVSTFTSAEAKGAQEYTLLPDGSVLAMAVGNATIPPGGMVISAHGQAAEWLGKRIHVGDKLQVRTAISDIWPHAKHVLGAGPLLVSDRQVKVTAEAEQFRPDIAIGRAPRTAVGIDDRGRMLLVTVDGRQPRTSIGLTLTGLAKLMIELGAVDALNLDGGGSTAMAIAGTTVTRPSDGSERAVNNALLVFGPAKAALAHW